MTNPDSKLMPRPIYDILTQSSNVLYRQTQPVVLRHAVPTVASGVDTVLQPSKWVRKLLVSTRTLCNRNRGVMLPHFLLASSIYRCLVCIWPVWRKTHQYQPDQPGVCDHVNLKTLIQTRMGEWRWLQIGFVVFDFPTRSIDQHKINLLNAEFSCAQTRQSNGNAVFGI